MKKSTYYQSVLTRVQLQHAAESFRKRGRKYQPALNLMWGANTVVSGLTRCQVDCRHVEALSMKRPLIIADLHLIHYLSFPFVVCESPRPGQLYGRADSYCQLYCLQASCLGCTKAFQEVKASGLFSGKVNTHQMLL